MDLGIHRAAVKVMWDRVGGRPRWEGCPSVPVSLSRWQGRARVLRIPPSSTFHPREKWRVEDWGIPPASVSLMWYRVEGPPRGVEATLCSVSVSQVQGFERCPACYRILSSMLGVRCECVATVGDCSARCVELCGLLKCKSLLWYVVSNGCTVLYICC